MRMHNGFNTAQTDFCEGTVNTQKYRVTLTLENGAVFEGEAFGGIETLRRKDRLGEVVFTTTMTGYQEVCTDPSYRGQMVVMTYPLIGNYGVADSAEESRRPWLSALIVREYCEEFSNWSAAESLDSYLRRAGIPGVSELDTRALTRMLREKGTLRGALHLLDDDEQPDIAKQTKIAQSARTVTELDVVQDVVTPEIIRLEPENGSTADTPHIALIDTGYKKNISSSLLRRGARVTIVPYSISIDDLLKLEPDGLLLSNGPGDPETVTHLIAMTRELIQRQIPMMGICLGHQIIGLAAGAKTSRLPFGHHGGNHPVIEVKTNTVTITTQNHNFQVDANSIPESSGFYVSHYNLSDGSVEGLAHVELPIFSAQYHPEAAPGPQDNLGLFDRFLQNIKKS